MVKNATFAEGDGLVGECPSEKELTSLLAGNETSPGMSAIESHVADCAACQDRLDALTQLPQTALLHSTESHKPSSRLNQVMQSLCVAERTVVDLPVVDSPEHAQRDGRDAGRISTAVTGSAATYPAAADSTNCSGEIIPLDSNDRVRAEQPSQIPEVIGCYEVGELIAEGSTGALYSGWDSSRNQSVALKILHPWLNTHTSALQRLKREALAAKKVRHPAVVKVIDFVAGNGQPTVLVMELLSRQTYDDLLRTDKLSLRDSLRLIAEAAHGLHALHKHGLVHRDVKPQNLLLDEHSDGRLRVVIGDLGLVRDEGAVEDLTRAENLLGTPAYMSPEQIESPEHVDARSDVYALGCVLYKTLASVPPFEGSVRMVLWQATHDEPRRPSQLNEAIDRDLDTICLKAISRRQSDRYQTAEEFAVDLERYLDGKPIRARQPALWVRLVRWSERRPAAAVAITAIVLILAGTTFASLAVANALSAANKREVDARQEAQRNSKVAEQNAIEAEQNALAAEAAAEYARRSEQNAQQRHRQAIETLVTVVEVVTKELAKHPGSAQMRQRLLTTALDGLQENTNAVLAGVSIETARTYRRIGELVLETGMSAEVTDIALLEKSLLGSPTSPSDSDGFAEKMFRKAISILKQFLDQHPGEPVAYLEIVDNRINLAALELRQGVNARQIAELEDIKALCQEKCQGPAFQLDFKHRLYNVMIRLSSGYEQLGKLNEAIAAQREACGVITEIAVHDPWAETLHDTLTAALPEKVVKMLPSGKDHTAVRNRFFSLVRLGELLVAADQDAEAVEHFSAAIPLGQQLCNGRDVIEQTVWSLAAVFVARADIAVHLGESHDAAALVQQAVELLEKANLESPGDPRTLRDLSHARQRSAEISAGISDLAAPSADADLGR